MSNLTIDYEQKYWTLLEEYSELLLYLQSNASLTYQGYLAQKELES